jgi:N6-L-threonylcarbamoyladenine synthase
MLILSIESSCDETSAAVTENGRRVLSNEILSQIDIHTVYGGVVPELASRNHIKVIKMLADEAVRKAGISKKDIDAVAVTFVPAYRCPAVVSALQRRRLFPWAGR